MTHDYKRMTITEAVEKFGKTEHAKPEKPTKHPERKRKPRPLDDDAMPPIITPDLPER